MTNEHLLKIRERADSVLDGFAKHREQLARDAHNLCDEVHRLNRTILGIRLKIAASERKGTKLKFGDDFWKDFLGG